MKFSFDEGGDNSDIREVIYGTPGGLGTKDKPTQFITRLETFASSFNTAKKKLEEKLAKRKTELEEDYFKELATLKKDYAKRLKVTIDTPKE